MREGARGFSRAFSLVELVVAMGVTAVVTAAVFALLDPSHGIFQAESETADVQQRLRVAVDAVSSALLDAGAGPYGADGPLLRAFAPVVPSRLGIADSDPGGTFRRDTIGIMSVPARAAQARLANAVSGPSPTLMLDTGECSRAACGFATGMTVLLYDPTSGRRDLAEVTGVDAAAGTLQVDSSPQLGDYPAGAVIVQAEATTLYLKHDGARDIDELASYSGDGDPDVPVADHVVGLTFEYYGDPAPPSLAQPLSDPVGPWTTYGPAPPPLAATGGAAYPAGENCAFAVDTVSGRQVPRLAALGPSSGLVPLTAAQLTDGPWCPDAEAPTRWDADLLRIRRVAVTVRVEAAVDALRGPAGVLFARGGTARGRFVPDQEARFEITPQNMSLGR
ncbi:MAG: PilW family protein [Betaproteobacteria bacterium]